MSQDSSVGSLKFFPSQEKPTSGKVGMLTRIGLLVCLVASIFVALNLRIFSNKPHAEQCFPLPEHSNGHEYHPIINTNASHSSEPPTNISHILFGLAAAARTWRNRSSYSKLWWQANTTRGFVWLDEELLPEQGLVDFSGNVPSHKVSEAWEMYDHLKYKPAVRIARIVYESFKLGLPNVRWFVMGDDDTVFFPDNLVTVLSKYDHNQMYYIGGNSECVESSLLHAYDMAYGGGGIAISYPLATQLAQILDGCLVRYKDFFTSDKRIGACVSEVGVPFTLERGFHQLDIRGDAYGILAAHPIAPLVSLHHLTLTYLKPIFLKQTTMEALDTLVGAYRVDPTRTLQQSFCYDRSRNWTISISWGYTIQVYTSLVTATDLQKPFATFKTFESQSRGPYTFDTRTLYPDPCKQPGMFFLDKVQDLGDSGTITAYKKFMSYETKNCTSPVRLDTIIVSAMQLDSDYWKQAPRRQCCEIMDGAIIKNATMTIRIRKCRPNETISI